MKPQWISISILTTVPIVADRPGIHLECGCISKISCHYVVLPDATQGLPDWVAEILGSFIWKNKDFFFHYGIHDRPTQMSKYYPNVIFNALHGCQSATQMSYSMYYAVVKLLLECHFFFVVSHIWQLEWKAKQRIDWLTTSTSSLGEGCRVLVE